MICKLENNITKQCGYSLKNIRMLYFANSSDVISVSNNGNIVTGITMRNDTVFYRVEPNRGATFLDELQMLDEDMGSFRNITVNFNLRTNEELDNLALGRFYIVAEGVDGVFYSLGQYMEAEEVTYSNTGISYTFQQNSLLSTMPLSDEAIAVVKAQPLPPPPPPYKVKVKYSDGTPDYSGGDCSENQTLQASDIPNLANVQEVWFGECITGTGRELFKNTTLETVHINSACTSFEQGTFSRTHLTSLTIPEGATSLPTWLGDTNPYLTSVTIPESVSWLSMGVFSNCPALTSVTIPSGVTAIDINSFDNCSGLTEIHVQAITPPYQDGAFDNTNNAPIYVPSGSVSSYKSAWSEYADRIQAEGEQPVSNFKFKVTYGDGTLPYSAECDTATTVYKYDIPNRSAITEAWIGDCVLSTGNELFQHCSALTAVHISSACTSFAGGTFSRTGLLNLELPEGTATVPYWCADYSVSLSSVTLPSSVTSIGDYAFQGCVALTEIHIHAITPPTIGYYSFDNTNIAHLHVPNGSLSAYQSSDLATYADEIIDDL